MKKVRWVVVAFVGFPLFAWFPEVSKSLLSLCAYSCHMPLMQNGNNNFITSSELV